MGGYGVLRIDGLVGGWVAKQWKMDGYIGGLVAGLEMCGKVG